MRLKRINSHVEVIVSDTGEGISAEFLPQVFDRFRQADGSITRSYGGLGLGLAIVRHLVEMQADSLGAGQGATFTVQLPLIAVHAVELPLTKERVHSTAEGDVAFGRTPALAGLRVLIVDDDDDTLEMLAAVLDQCGAEVKSASSAAAALETLQGWKPDVLVSDIGMPGEDGYTLIGKVRALEPEHGTQILAVALTAHARTEDRMRALSSGFQMHVPKPVKPAELIMVIESLTRHQSIRTT